MKSSLLALAASLTTLLPFSASGQEKAKQPIVIVLTSVDRLGDTEKPTGFFLSEASHPWEVFRKAGYPVVLASTKGGPSKADPKSHPSEDPVNHAFWKAYHGTAEGILPQTAALNTLSPADYAAVFFAGGHGTMWDFPQSEAITRFIEDMEAKGRVIAAVCHGPVALVNARRADGEPFVKERRIAVFTNEEEEAVQLTDVVPFLPETRFRELGANVITGAKFQENAIRDGRLITGQNPASATRTAELVVEALQEATPEKNDSPQN